jgi:hypothetical protein
MSSPVLVQFAREATFEPSRITANTYQLTIEDQVQYDDKKHPDDPDEILGIPVKPYMLSGAAAEFEETHCEDQNHPGYNRMVRLMTAPGAQVAGESPEALCYHAKEFGDLAWYAGNFAGQFGIVLSSTLMPIKNDTRIADVDKVAHIHAHRGNRERWKDSGFYFLTAAESYLATAHEVLKHDHEDAPLRQSLELRQELKRSTGRLLIASSIVLQSKLDTTLAHVMSDNATKVDRRIREGKVFAPGGDAR